MTTRENRGLAVVTGASSGIGWGLARVLAEEGFDLLIAAEDIGIHARQRELMEAGARVDAVQVDLARYEGVEQLYGAIAGAGRPVEILALNAGVGVGGGFSDTSLAAELNLIQLNVVSTVHLAKRVVQDMVARRRGRILFTSSIAATMPAPFEAVYGASKAFVQMFAEALRNELKDSGVTVTSLQPGATETEFFERAGMQDTKVGAERKDDPAEVARQGYEALMAGKDHVVAGSFKNKVQALGAKILPQTAGAQMHRNLSEPGSAPK